MEYKLKGSEFIESLSINLLVKDDIKDIIKMLQNPKVTEYLFFAPAPEEVFKGYFEPMARDIEEKLEKGEMLETLTFTIRESNGTYVGELGIVPVPMAVGVYEVGYQFDEAYWGRGIASAACKLGIELAFEVLGAHRVEANCYTNNIGSRRVLEKNGLKLEGISRSYHKDGNKLVDRANYGILKKQYSK